MLLQPLKGLKVVDWTEGVAGPYACQLLGDLGAEVIKVERPEGDWGRTLGDDKKAHFRALNRNKRGICIDVKSSKSKKVMDRLLRDADILVTSYRPGVMERFGYSFEDVREINERLIYGRISAFGYTGELTHLPGSDTILQALSGFMTQVGEPESTPYRVGIPIVDLVAARDLVVGILSAVICGERGQPVQGPIDINLFASFAALQAQTWQQVLETGKNPIRSGNRNPMLSPAGIFEGADNKYFSLVVLRDEHWQRLCKALGDEKLSENKNYSTNSLRLAYRDELEEKLNSLFSLNSRDYWLEKLSKYDVLVAPILEFNEILEDPQLGKAIPRVEVPSSGLSDAYHAIAPAVGIGDTNSLRVKYGTPEKGEHTQEILSELEFTSEEINSLFEDKVISSSSAIEETLEING